MTFPLKSCLLALSIILLSISCSDYEDLPVVRGNSKSSIIPLPREISYSKGEFLLGPDAGIFLSGTTDDRVPDYFSAFLKKATGKAPRMQTDSARANIFFTVNKNFSDPNNEAYELIVTPDRMTMTSGTEAGLFRGLQSLFQLLPPQFLGESNGKKQRWALPAVQISDAPRFKWRGMLLDCCRHFMEPEFVKRYIDLLAFYKMNTLHWHLTEDQGWRIEIDKYPLLTEVGAWRTEEDGSRYGGYYSKEDIRDIVAYAESRFITIVPEIEMPGHSVAAIAAYPHLSCTGASIPVETEWGVFKDIYCAGNDSTFLFLQDVLDEVIALFPGDYFHIGGDEAPKSRWEECPRCQKRLQDEHLEDFEELQSYFISRIEKYLNSQDKKLIGWDEILEGGLSPNAAVQSWRGFEGAVKAVKQGHPAVVSPTSHAYFDYPVNITNLEKVYSFEPVPEGLTDSEARLILGGECNMWTERAPQELVDSKVFPRLTAMAEVLWTAKELRSYSDFYKRLQSNYPYLDALEVDYGLEAVPIKITTFLSKNQLYVDLKKQLEPLDVQYSLGDSSATLYSGPVAVNRSVQLAVQAIRNEKAYGKPIIQKISAHLANFKETKNAEAYHKNYSANGTSAMVDGLKGGKDFKDGNWQGTWATDQSYLIDLGEVKEIREVSVGALQYNNAWIFFPENMAVFGAAEKGGFRQIATMKNASNPKEKGQLTQDYKVQVDPQMLRFIRVDIPNFGECPDWHDAAGSPTWLFIDEIEVR